MLKSKRILCICIAAVMIVGMLSGCSNTNEKQAAASQGGNQNQIAAANANEQNIDEENILGIIKELILPKYSGRKTGTEGNLMAAEYIAQYFKELNLENPKGLDNYMHYYEQPVVDLKSEPLLQLIDGNGNVIKEYEHAENFVLRALDDAAADIDVTAPLYVVKDGNELSKDNKDIKGKIILLSEEVRGQLSMTDVVQTLDDMGVVAAIGEYDISSEHRRTSWLPVTPVIGRWLFTRSQHNPYINVDDITYEELVKAAELGQKLSLMCSYSIDYDKKVPNVIGMITGSDEKLKNEYIIIGAHMDHVGDNMNGTYNPGALDNASGTASIMEIARVLKANKVQPKKTILFMVFNGEEGGLIGSREYVKNPIYPLDNAVMINLDMVGSSENLPLTIESPPGQKADFRNELVAIAKELGIEVQAEVGGGSDHASFAEAGVPAALLINLDFANGYHSSHDTIEDVSKPRLEQYVKLVLQYIDKNAY